MYKLNDRSGFGMIGILFGIFIFSLGLILTYVLLQSAVGLNIGGKNYIIATYLAQEQLELVRNIRDSNDIQIKPYNQTYPTFFDNNNTFAAGRYYKISNDYSLHASYPMIIEDITSSFGEGVNELGGAMSKYQLYLDDENRYTFDALGNKQTYFYRYIYIDKVEDADGIIDNALKVSSKVIWNDKGYHEFELNTLITDWKRL